MVGKMDRPTGPTGVLTSGKMGMKAGGKKTMGARGGMVASPMKKTGMGRKIGRR